MANARRKIELYLSATKRLHLVHDAEQNARIMKACRRGRAVQNRTVRHLLDHQADEPVQTSAAKGQTGRYLTLARLAGRRTRLRRHPATGRPRRHRSRRRPLTGCQSATEYVPLEGSGNAPIVPAKEKSRL